MTPETLLRVIVDWAPSPDQGRKARECIQELMESRSSLPADERPVSAERELPLGVAEIAALLGVQRASVDRMRARGRLPEPAGKISGSPVWFRDDVVAWAQATGRLTLSCS